jgi:hypothetical protein
MKNTKSTHQIIQSAIAVAASIILAGCITTATTVERHKPSQTFQVVSAETSEQTTALAVPTDVHARFQQFFDEELYSRGGFQRGPQLKIKWQFAEFDAGSRALRYFVGFGAGKGKITVHAMFLDERGHEIAAVDGFGTVVMGAFGGSYDSALRECAYEITKYAKDNFLTRSSR